MSEKTIRDVNALLEFYGPNLSREKAERILRTGDVEGHLVKARRASYARFVLRHGKALREKHRK